MRAVRFDHYGGVEVLEVHDVVRPEPWPDQVLVEVRAAGINPSEGKIRAGVVREVGSGVTGVAVASRLIVYSSGSKRAVKWRRRGGS